MSTSPGPATPTARGPVVGVDLGARRIGVAVSDPGGTIASPREVIPRHDGAHQRLADIVREVGAVRVVVGLPLSLSGRTGPAARAALAEAGTLAEVVGVPVETCDERLSTVSADRSMTALKIRPPARRQMVDKVAAAVMLQSWLDRQAGAGSR